MAEERNGEGAGRSSRARKKRALAVFLVATLLIVAAGGVYWWYRQTHIWTDDAFVEGNIHPVSARIPGKVAEILVDDNQRVRKGQPLLRIDREPFAVRVAAAGSSVSAATATVDAARSDIRAARAAIRAARQDVAAARVALDQARLAVKAAHSRVALAEAQLAQAKRDAQRAVTLYAQESISRERYEKMLTERDVSLARRNLARDELRLAEAAIPSQEAMISQKEAGLTVQKAMLAQRKAKLGQQDAVVRQRKSTLAEAELHQGYTDVDAPADGYVTRKTVEVGQIVSPGQPLLAVTDLSVVWVIANYKETEIEKIRPGDPVEIEVDTYPGKTFHGKVNSIMAGTGSAFSLFPPENATGNYVKVVQRIPVKIVLDRGEDPGHLLRVGMSVVPTVLIR